MFPQVIPLSPVVYPLNTLEYHVNLGSVNALTPEVLQAITGFRCAAGYIVAAMIFLKDNTTRT